MEVRKCVHMRKCMHSIVSHCLVEMSGPDLYRVLQRSRADDLPLGELEGGGIMLMR